MESKPIGEQQPTCITCNSMRAQLILIERTSQALALHLVCLNCGMYYLYNLNTNKPEKKADRDVSYAG